MPDIKCYIHRDNTMISLVAIVDGVKLLSVYYENNELNEQKLQSVIKLLRRLDDDCKQ